MNYNWNIFILIINKKNIEKINFFLLIKLIIGKKKFKKAKKSWNWQKKVEIDKK